MVDQETLDQGADRLGERRASIYVRFRNGDDIDRSTWTAAVHEGHPVGECECGSYLRALPQEHRGDRIDYVAQCTRPPSVHSRGFAAGCGKEYVMPGGRIGGRRAA